jgi:hypothetical protein
MNIDASAVSQNPFAVITIIAAPAILTNASSILTLSTSTRLMRCLDRINQLTERLDRDRLSPEVKAMHVKQIELSHKQSRQFLGALRWIYVTLASFAVASFLALLGAATMSLIPLAFVEGLATASLVAGAIGVLGIIWSSINLINASRITVVIMSADMEHLQRHRHLVP